MHNTFSNNVSIGFPHVCTSIYLFLGFELLAVQFYLCLLLCVFYCFPLFCTDVHCFLLLFPMFPSCLYLYYSLTQTVFLLLSPQPTTCVHYFPLLSSSFPSVFPLFFSGARLCFSFTFTLCFPLCSSLFSLFMSFPYLCFLKF